MASSGATAIAVAPSAIGMANMDCRNVIRATTPNPPTIDHPATSLGPAVRNRDPPIREFFPKKLGGTRNAKGVSSRPHHVCYWGQLGRAAAEGPLLAEEERQTSYPARSERRNRGGL